MEHSDQQIKREPSIPGNYENGSNVKLYFQRRESPLKQHEGYVEWSCMAETMRLVLSNGHRLLRYWYGDNPKEHELYGFSTNCHQVFEGVGTMNAPVVDFALWLAFLCLMNSSPFVGCQVPVPTFRIEESQFSCDTGGNLRCSRNATTTTEGLLKLTPDPPGRNENFTYYLGTSGVALYKDPVQVLNRSTNQAASLNISFSFQIEQGVNGPGDGMAFVMFSEASWVGGAGRALAAFMDDGRAGVETLAVEFDTFQNEGVDDDSNHVGVDIMSITSDKAVKVPFSLTDGSRVYAWIEYHPESFLLEVRVNNLLQRPDKATIRYNRNLLDVFNVDSVWVGFSGANGGCTCFSFYTVHNLDFQSTIFSAPSPSPAPLQVPEGGTQAHTNSTGLENQIRNSKSSNSGLIAGVTVGVVGILVGGCSLLFCARSLRKREVDTVLLSAADGSPPAPAMHGLGKEFMAGLSLEKFSYAQLCEATENFSDSLKLGEGGFGSVYRGSIPVEKGNSNLLVAVKKVSSDSKQGEREFLAEVSTIGMLRHRNIVQLLGWCSESEGNYLLVYEYMPNGSLDRHLYPRTISQKAGRTFFLTWKERMKILRGIAAALHYLHEGWRQQVIHRDVKSSNVMLDDDLNAMLGDFGLARMSDHFKNPATTFVAGTYGFIAPEVSMTGKYTLKSDVFSFGAVCLEVVCGRRVYDDTYPVEETLLVDFVWRKLSEDQLLSVVDRRLEGGFEVEEVEAVLLLGLLCSHPKPDDRPTMHGVLEILAGRVELPVVPRTKPEGDHYAYPYKNKERKLFLSNSGRRLSSHENGFQSNQSHSGLSNISTRSSSTTQRSQSFSSLGATGSSSKEEN
ncbi:hypothetical protein R1sor_008301 [Riccia sorocarpa]|uniref:non-specific serine/threonine protein kinase n=1 Tax=Riccia sorocarpa TaxID=122646 RepID=A0ABD3HSY5_9MARC